MFSWPKAGVGVCFPPLSVEFTVGLSIEGKLRNVNCIWKWGDTGLYLVEVRTVKSLTPWRHSSDGVKFFG